MPGDVPPAAGWVLGRRLVLLYFRRLVQCALALAHGLQTRGHGIQCAGHRRQALLMNQRHARGLDCLNAGSRTCCREPIHLGLRNRDLSSMCMNILSESVGLELHVLLL